MADDGTVFVKTAEGERAVGQYPEGDPAEALKFFTDRYDALAFEVELLETRIKAGALAPDEAVGSVKTVRGQVADAHAVGDLVGLTARLDALSPVIAEQREARGSSAPRRSPSPRWPRRRSSPRPRSSPKAPTGATAPTGSAPCSTSGRRCPAWTAASDDTLWRRFSTARTSYTRRRKSHFADQHEKRDVARGIKERLVKEAESLADSTEWGATAGGFRDLMREWKEAGPAPRDVDDALWKRFRGAQDQFFGARDATNAELDREFAANAEVKEQLLVEAEKLVPVTDLDAAKRAFRDIADKWDAAGKVPRERMKDLESRIRKVEQAIRGVEDDQWRRVDPEKSARADDMVSKLEDAIAKVESDLDKARASGNDRKVKELEDNLASRLSFLEMARKASDEFSG